MTGDLVSKAWVTLSMLALGFAGIAELQAQPGLHATRRTGDPWRAASPPHLLTNTFVAEVASCRGWGQWTTPFVLANRSAEAAQLLSGLITIPAGSVAVHPGPDRDVAVAWRSPIAGRVNLRAKVADAHPVGGDGIVWAILQETPAGAKPLAQGVIDPGGSQSIPAAADRGALTGLAVQPGDTLALVIGRRDNHHCDTTRIEWVISEAESGGRVWDLAKEVAPDIESGNPHRDALGHSAVWYFSAPPGSLRLTETPEASLTAPPAQAGRDLAAWRIATDDTRLTVGATEAGQLVVSELQHPGANWNWIGQPSVLPLVARAAVRDTQVDLRWTYRDGALDTSDGHKATLRFTCAAPALELTSQWWARPGRGPVEHAMVIVNRAAEPVTLFEQPTVHLNLAAPPGDAFAMWTFHSDGGTPDPVGVYGDAVEPPFHRLIRTQPEGEFIPYAVFESGRKHGVYVGIAWSYCRIAAAAVKDDAPGTVRVRGGEFAEFQIRLEPGETFEVPPGFVGAYRGDLDDAGNGLRRHLFRYHTPRVLRQDEGYPKVQWNAFGATGKKPGGWDSVESKYYPLVDDIAPLGFEEVMLDVGWWKGETQAPEPEADPEDWPSGMAKAAAYAHQKGLRFGLYWNKGEDMATPEGRARRSAHVKRLFNEYRADLWRSDSTGGPVIAASYGAVRGFYAMLDQLDRELPHFQWENCSGGGRIKDFGALRRAVKIFITDTYAALDVRQAFYDSAFAFPLAQLEGCLGSTDGRFRPQGPDGMRFAFRSASLGAPEWFIDAPSGGNGTTAWTDEEKAAVQAAVVTYKTKIRTLVRHADLYHVLPRPDGRNWDGIQYHDPATQRGAVYLFKPAAGRDSMVIPLRGLEPDRRYRVTFEDGSNPTVERTGTELANGLPVTLRGASLSELVFLEGTRPNSSTASAVR